VIFSQAQRYIYQMQDILHLGKKFNQAIHIGAHH